jgi:hypothetical protein
VIPCCAAQARITAGVAPAGGRPPLNALVQPGRVGDASPVLDELGQRLSQTRGVPFTEVDLVARTVDAEYDGFSGPAAVDVVQQGDGRLPRHW